MWHLDILDTNKEKEYCDLLFEKVKEQKGNISNNTVKNYLTDTKIKKILISKPNDLYSKINEYKSRLFCSEYDNWNRANQKQDRYRTREEKDIIIKYKDIVDTFDYDNFIRNKKNDAYKIAKLIGVNSCVYCNRQYIFTVDKENEHITRPEFDHYLPKSEYPFFALSLYNLIPSCHICNSNCKGTEKLDESMNPYRTDKDDYFTFTYHIDGKEFPASVQIKDKDKLDDKVKKLLDTFKIQEIYDAHTNLELKDLYTFATKYSKTYLHQIMTDLKLSQEDAYRILFGTEMLPDKDNDRPLSKFKRDILRELKVIP
ncbi:MAG: hypothetical protein LBE13_12620 [Bacteroidales bacterium]|jgi:hypothetical protein|nr:hypothetical protein [Bacteroidales bacterium]